MRNWNRGWALLACLAIAGCSTSPDRGGSASRPVVTAERSGGNLYSARLAALEDEMARVGEKRAWSARYLAGSTMVDAVAAGNDLLVEAFNADTRNYEVHCIDLRNGEPRWVVVLGKSPLKHPPGVGDRFVVFLLEDGGMMVVTRKVGSHYERLRLPLVTVPLGPAGSSDSTVYVSSLSDQRVHALSPETGQRGWGHRSSALLTTAPLVTPRLPRRLVVVGNDAGDVIALPAASWKDIPPRGPTWTYRALGRVTADMAAGTMLDPKTGNMQLFILVPCEDNGLYCLDGAAGEPRWIHRSDHPFSARPQIAGSRVFARNEERMHVLDLVKGGAGAGAWAASAPGEPLKPFEKADRVLAADDRRAYLVTGDRYVMRVDGRTGEPRTSARMVHFDKLVPAPEADVLVGLTTDGHIVAFK